MASKLGNAVALGTLALYTGATGCTTSRTPDWNIGNNPISEDYSLGQFTGEVVEWGKEMAKTYPNNSTPDSSLGTPFQDVGRNLENSLDNLGNGSDATYTNRESGAKVVSPNDRPTLYDMVRGEGIWNEKGIVNWNQVPAAGPAVKYLIDIPRGVINSSLGFAGELGSSIINTMGGGFGVLAKGSDFLENKLGSNVGYASHANIFIKDSLQAVNAITFEHIFGGREAGKFLESLLNGIITGDMSVEYSPRNSRYLISPGEDNYIEALQGAERGDMPDTTGTAVMRGASTIAVNAALGAAIVTSGSSSGSGELTNSGGGFNPGNGGGVGQ